MVAEVTMISSAIRVMMENVPEPMVSMPSESKACWDAGTIQRYQMRMKGVATNEGTSQRTLHLTMLVFNSACLSPSMRLAVMSAQMPARARRRRRAGRGLASKWD